MKQCVDYDSVAEWAGSDTGDTNQMLTVAIETLVSIANGSYTAEELKQAVIELQQNLNVQ